MLTITKTQEVNLKTVVSLALEMRKSNLDHIFPDKAINQRFKHQGIEELILDDEGNAFLMLSQYEEPVVLPKII